MARGRRYSASTALGEVLGECPFCGSSVSEDLVTYGGTCPKCFAEIPGEEAPTDPGIEVREAQDRRDRMWQLARTVASVSAMLAVVSCTGAVAFALVLWPEPEVADLLDFDTLDFPMPDDIVGAEDVAAAKPRPRRTAQVTEPGPGGAADPGGPGLRTTLSPVSAELGGDGGLSKPAPVSLSIEAPTVRRDANVVLSDPSAIRDMIGERMVEFIPGLNQCYERRLKQNPSLKGRWRVHFTVQADGGVSGAGAEALERRDTELERCLSEHIEKNWRFGRITMASVPSAGGQ
jgi:hypothetical protein